MSEDEVEMLHATPEISIGCVDQQVVEKGVRKGVKSLPFCVFSGLNYSLLLVKAAKPSAKAQAMSSTLPVASS